MKEKEIVRIANSQYKKGDYESAFGGYKIVAQNGDPDCQKMVGKMLLFGEGVSSDIEEAKSWLKESSKYNIVEGKYYLGALYHIEGNYSRAIEYYEETAKEGFSPSYLRLGAMNELGRGIPVDHKNALYFYKMAVSLGNIPSRRQISILQIKGVEGMSGRIVGLFNFLIFLFLLVKEVIRDPDSFRLNR